MVPLSFFSQWRTRITRLHFMLLSPTICLLSPFHHGCCFCQSHWHLTLPLFIVYQFSCLAPLFLGFSFFQMLLFSAPSIGISALKAISWPVSVLNPFLWTLSLLTIPTCCLTVGLHLHPLLITEAAWLTSLSSASKPFSNHSQGESISPPWSWPFPWSL